MLELFIAMTSGRNMHTCHFLLENREYFGLDYRLLLLAITNEVNLCKHTHTCEFRAHFRQLVQRAYNNILVQWSLQIHVEIILTISVAGAAQILSRSPCKLAATNLRRLRTKQ